MKERGPFVLVSWMFMMLQLALPGPFLHRFSGWTGGEFAGEGVTNS
jgi:hypothetical protein